MALGNPLSRLQQAFARLLARFHKKFLTFRSAFIGARIDAAGAVAYSGHLGPPTNVISFSVTL
jgi:hypothetical protein